MSQKTLVAMPRIYRIAMACLALLSSKGAVLFYMAGNFKVGKAGLSEKKPIPTCRVSLQDEV